MFECVLLNLFIIVASGNMKTNEFHIFKTFKIENVGQGHGGEKRNLCHSIANGWLFVTYFFIILAVQQYLITNEFHIL